MFYLSGQSDGEDGEGRWERVECDEDGVLRRVVKRPRYSVPTRALPPVYGFHEEADVTHPWTSPPSEILSLIEQHASGDRTSILPTLRLVCKNWCNAVNALVAQITPSSSSMCTPGWGHTISHTFPNVSSLDFHMAETTPCEGVVCLTSLLCLVSLTMRGCNNFTDTSLSALSELCTLKVLDMTRFKLYQEGMSMDVRLDFLQGLTNLVELSLARCHIHSGDLVFMLGLQKLRYLNLCGTEVTDQAMEHLSKLPGLAHLNVGMCCMTDKGVDLMTCITSLRYLNLCELDVTAQCVQNFTVLQQLVHLSLHRCVQFDSIEGLKTVGGIHSIQRLNLGNTDADDQALVGLTNLTDLEYLNLYGCENITNTGLSKIACLSSLTYLRLGECGVSDAGLQVLSSFPCLSHLNVSRCSVTDVGLAYIGRLTGLKTLNLSGVQGISNQGLVQLTTLGKLVHLDLMDIEGVTAEGLAGLTPLTKLLSIEFSMHCW